MNYHQTLRVRLSLSIEENEVIKEAGLHDFRMVECDSSLLCNEVSKRCEQKNYPLIEFDTYNTSPTFTFEFDGTPSQQTIEAIAKDICQAMAPVAKARYQYINESGDDPGYDESQNDTWPAQDWERE